MLCRWREQVIKALNGVCFYRVWSFTIDINFLVPKVCALVQFSAPSPARSSGDFPLHGFPSVSCSCRCYRGKNQ